MLRVMRNHDHPFCWLIGRLIWVLMLVSHLYWLVAGLRSGSATFLSSAFLVLAIAGFFLKAIDARWLRVAWTREKVIAAVLIVLLIHVGVIGDALSTQGDAAQAWLPAEAVSLGMMRLVLGLVSLAGLVALSLVLRVWASGHHPALGAQLAFFIDRRIRSLASAPLRAPPA